jgi:hypothetical protein
MFSSKPKPIMIITILLLVLAMLNTTSILASRTGFVRPAGFTNSTNFQANNGNGANGNGNFQTTNGSGSTGNGNFQGNTGTGGFQRRNGFNTFTIFRSLGLSRQVILYATLGITILGILLTLLSAFGVWKQKSGGLNLAMVMAVLFMLGAVPGLLNLGSRNINLLRTSITLLTFIASAPILIFGILPSVRDTVTAK